MNKLTLSLIVVALFFSCKKSDTSEVRLLRINSYNSDGTLSLAKVFDYNQQGQITRVSNAGNSSSVIAEIVYSGSDIIIIPTPEQNATRNFSSEIRYTTDASGQPLRRIESSTETYYAPNAAPQYRYKTDTANYEYNGSGLLVKKTYNGRDSVWSNTGYGPNIEIHTIRNTAVYTNNNNSLTQIIKTGFDSAWVKNSTASKGFMDLVSETYKFNYSKGYQNQTDFTNSVILTEYGNLPYDFYPLNKSYSNFPDNIVTSTERRPLSTGEIISDNQTVNLTLNNNRLGFIYNLKSYLPNGTLIDSKNIIYSK